MTLDEMNARECSCIDGDAGEAVKDTYYRSSCPDDVNIVMDAAPNYETGTREESHFQIDPEKQGSYTLEDYYEIPDDERYELIDGYLYRMESPSMVHQRLLIYLGHKIYSLIEEHNCACEVFVAPFDVQLDKDERTLVEPDVLVICDPEKLTKKKLYGAPDLAVEILSPSTRSKDMFLKLNKYWKAGVKEYWIIDPRDRNVTVYIFDGDNSSNTQYLGNCETRSASSQS